MKVHIKDCACGGKAKDEFIKDYWYIYCTKCGMQMKCNIKGIELPDFQALRLAQKWNNKQMEASKLFECMAKNKVK